MSKTADGGVEDLPASRSAKERHEAHISAGMHPSIEMGDEYRGVLNGLENGIVIKDGDRLIGFMERDTCPVCGESNNLSIRETTSYTFVRGATTRESTDDGWQQNEVIERLERNKYRPILCRAGGNKYLVGLASPSAYETYAEWADQADERRRFKGDVQQLRSTRYHEDTLAGTYDHGHLLAAIYEELGCDSYDTRDLMGRTHITKSHLAALLARVKALDVTERRDYTEDDWLASQEFGIVQGRVEWHIPEWVDFEGLNYSDHYKTTLFE